MNVSDDPMEAWTQPWPADGLESVAHCPVCGEAEREVMYTDLVDNVFQAAPGKWTLWECAQCGSAYLDPRPTPDTIHLAYSNYHTQRSIDEPDYASLSPLRKLRRRLRNGYTNWRFSTREFPASCWGVPIMLLLFYRHRGFARHYRHLPKCPRNGGRLLDVGCGIGGFLKVASSCGWDAVGVDPAPKACARAAEEGLTVYLGSVEYFDGQTSLFDVITLDHVIEHMHDPIAALRICYVLLKPGGQIWIETPNIDSFGHARFKKNWRGLEPPRHLVLFNHRSLHHALIAAGFPPPSDCTRPSPCVAMFKTSSAMEHNYPVNRIVEPTPPMKVRLEALVAASKGEFLPSRREYLTISTCKPKE